jgi:hypothetical protein
VVFDFNVLYSVCGIAWKYVEVKMQSRDYEQFL